jgi:hypothetical protein
VTGRDMQANATINARFIRFSPLFIQRIILAEAFPACYLYA